MSGAGKPTTHLNWTDGAPTKVIQPTVGKQLLGWVANEKPPAEFFNWLFYTMDQWNKFFECEVDTLSAMKGFFDAVVGVGGTHASLADLMADANIATIKHVLVNDPQTLTSTVTLDQDDMTFYFKPQAVIAKGVGLTKGVIIDAERVRMEKARFINFAASGDIALELAVTSKYCMVDRCYFANNDTALNDLGTQNGLTGNIEEL